MTTREGRPEPFAWIDTTGAPVERKEVGDLPGSKFSPRQTLEAADAVKVLAHDGIALADIGAVSPYRAGAEKIYQRRWRDWKRQQCISFRGEKRM